MEIKDVKTVVTVASRPQDIPADWIIMNAPRPLVGDASWEGDFRHGIFYVAIDPNNDEPPGVEWRMKTNKGLDAWVVIYVFKELMRSTVRQSIVDMKYYSDKPEVIEKMMEDERAVEQTFFNILENKTVGEVTDALKHP